jgi:hypothetical protein
MQWLLTPSTLPINAQCTAQPELFLELTIIRSVAVLLSLSDTHGGLLSGLMGYIR